MAQNMYRGDAPAEILPKEVSSEIWQDAQDESAVMRFSNRIDLPGSGIEIPMITADPQADWVAETDEITAGKSSLSHRAMQGYKLGVIETFSNEFKRDLPAVYDELRRRLPKTLAAKFDSTVFHGAAGTPGSNFDHFTAASVQVETLTQDNAYDTLVNVDEKVSLAGGALSAYVLAPQARGVLLRAKDADERPLLVNDVQRDGAVSQLLGVDVAGKVKAVYKAGSPESAPDAGDGVAPVLGFAGDFGSTYYGVVQDIGISVTDQSSVTVGGSQINLWQRDMFAVKVTVHLGFLMRDGARFVRIDGAVPTAA